MRPRVQRRPSHRQLLPAQQVLLRLLVLLVRRDRLVLPARLDPPARPVLFDPLGPPALLARSDLLDPPAPISLSDPPALLGPVGLGVPQDP